MGRVLLPSLHDAALLCEMPTPAATANVIPFPSSHTVSSSFSYRKPGFSASSKGALTARGLQQAYLDYHNRTTVKPLPTKFQRKRLPGSFLQDLKASGPFIIAESLDRDGRSYLSYPY